MSPSKHSTRSSSNNPKKSRRVNERAGKRDKTAVSKGTTPESFTNLKKGDMVELTFSSYVWEQENGRWIWAEKGEKFLFVKEPNLVPSTAQHRALQGTGTFISQTGVVVRLAPENAKLVIKAEEQKTPGANP